MMGTKREILDSLGPHTTPDCDLEKALHWLRGDRYYLQGSSHQGMAKISAAGVLVDQAGQVLGSVRELLQGRGRHNLVIGSPNPGDSLIHYEQRRAGHTATHATYDFEYNGSKTITAIFVRDNWDDDTGGDAKVVSGGLGKKNVKVRVTSQLLRGFDHTLYVYGK